MRKLYVSLSCLLLLFLFLSNYSLYLFAEEVQPESSLAEVDINTDAAPDTPPAEPVKEAPTAEVTPAESVKEAPAAADSVIPDTPPAESVDEAPAADSAPANEAPATDSAPAEPANDTPEDVGIAADSVVPDTPLAEPVKDTPADADVAAADTPPAEPVNAFPAEANAAPAMEEGPVPAEPEAPVPSESQTSDSVQKDRLAQDSNLSQTGSQEQTDQAVQTEAVLKAQEDTAPETWSIILKNQIYGDTTNAQAKDLSAGLTLRIEGIASLPACPEGWTVDNDTDSYFRELVLRNMESQTIPGIPFSCPVWVEKPTLLKEGNAALLPYSGSAIVDGIYQKDISSDPDLKLNKDGSQRGNCEYTLVWTANHEDNKPVYIINDSDTALSLSCDTEGASVLFVPGDAEQSSSGNTAGVIEIPANGWGFLTVTPENLTDTNGGGGNAAGSNANGSNAAGTNVTLTPLNANVEKVIPSVGSADSEGSWALGQDPVSDGSYVVYRVKPLKTGDDDKEKTGDDIPDSPEPSKPSEPEGKDTPPDQPGNTEHLPEEGKEPTEGNDLPQEPEHVPVSEKAGEKPPKPASHSSEDSVKKAGQPAGTAGSTSIRISAGDGTHVAVAGSVDTADRTPAERYAGMMLLAGMAAAAMLLMRKKLQR